MAGGSCGDALARDPELVLADVRDGVVTVEAAAREYGVAVTKGKGSWTIDTEATHRLRARMRA
jgi:N-methylhydantoinase B